MQNDKNFIRIKGLYTDTNKNNKHTEDRPSLNDGNLEHIEKLYDTTHHDVDETYIDEMNDCGCDGGNGDLDDTNNNIKNILAINMICLIKILNADNIIITINNINNKIPLILICLVTAKLIMNVYHSLNTVIIKNVTNNNNIYFIEIFNRLYTFMTSE